MNYIEEALRVLLENKVRSLLTILGLIIGVAAVIAILVLGNGMAGAVNGTLGNLNDRSFILSANAFGPDQQEATIHLSDITNIERSVPNIASAIPVGVANEIVHVTHQLFRFSISDDTGDHVDTTKMAQGRDISVADVNSMAQVCVISNEVFKKLFPEGGDVIGRSIYAGAYRFVVIGVHVPPTTGLLNVNFSGDITIPYTVFQQYYLHDKTTTGVQITVIDDTIMTQTEQQVRQKIKELHFKSGRTEYTTFDKAQLTGAINSVFGALTMVVGLIGAVSLLVAGIGIMNIMLVSVTERTREIGVRKAIGAQRSQILLQFFIEALVLCAAGCGIGLAIGLTVGWLVNHFAIIALTGYVAPIPWLQSTLIAVSFATVVTIVFGTYPAYRAAALDPIEALRYE